MRTGKTIALLFLSVSYFTLVNGFLAFSMTLKWFPMADMLRGLVIDLGIISLLLTVPPIFFGVVYGFISLFYVFTGIANIGHQLVYGAGLSLYAVHSVFETTASESLEFFTDHMTPFRSFFISAIIVIYLHIVRCTLQARAKSTFHGTPIKVAAITVIVVASIVSSKGPRLLKSHVPANAILAIDQYFTDIRILADVFRDKKHAPFTGVKNSSMASNVNKTVVLVLGESANRNHHSIYGYTRDTTPHLQARRSKLHVFTDVISPDTHTIPSLRKMLLFSNNDSTDDALLRPSVLQLFRQAGFSTYWISNQTISSDGVTGTSLIASDANERFFLNKASSEGKSTSFDEVVLPAFQEILAKGTGNRFIVVHLLGSHLTYALRYPRSFEYFTDTKEVEDSPVRTVFDKQYINAYDNSIRYTDHVVNSLLQILETAGGVSTLLYLSDHGQEVYDTRPVRGQVANNPSKHMYDVPFLVWLSPDYTALRSAWAEGINKRVDTPATSSGLGHALASLAEIEFDAYDAKKDIFSSEYDCGTRKATNGDLYESLDR